MNILKIDKKNVAFFLSVILSIVCLGGIFVCLPAYAALDSWNETSTKQAITNFVDQVIADGIPESERIAVFDNDGTLWTERPHYFQEDFIKKRLSGLSQIPEGPDFNFLTTGEYKSLAHDFLFTTKHNELASSNDGEYERFNTEYINLTYKPVIELVNYLKENGFKVYICSGGGIYFVRSFSDEAYGIPSEEVIGSAIKTKYDEFNITDGRGGSLVRQLELAHYDDQEGKPVGIELFIGKRPLIAVGNSGGDFEMFKYSDEGVDKSLIVLINHDDCEREYEYNNIPGSTDSSTGEPLNESLDEALNRENWLVVSMKNDFNTIFDPIPPRTSPICSN